MKSPLQAPRPLFTGGRQKMNCDQDPAEASTGSGQSLAWFLSSLPAGEIFIMRA
jgi:hypothetical protein